MFDFDQIDTMFRKVCSYVGNYDYDQMQSFYKARGHGCKI